MLANLRLIDMRLTTAQQRSTCQNLPSDLYLPACSCVCLYEHVHLPILLFSNGMHSKLDLEDLLAVSTKITVLGDMIFCRFADR
jgi:hypothetical protein